MAGEKGAEKMAGEAVGARGASWGADLRVAPPVDTGTPVSTRILACPDLLTDLLTYLLTYLLLATVDVEREPRWANRTAAEPLLAVLSERVGERVKPAQGEAQACEW